MTRRPRPVDSPETLAAGFDADELATYVSDPGALPEERLEELREAVSLDPELAEAIALLKNIGSPAAGDSSPLTVDELEADWRQLSEGWRARRGPGASRAFRLAAVLAVAAVGLAISWLILKGPWWNAEGEAVMVDLFAESPPTRSADPGTPAPPVGVVEAGSPTVVFVLNALESVDHESYRIEILEIDSADERLAFAASPVERRVDGTWHVPVPGDELLIGRHRLKLYGAMAGAEEAEVASFLFRVVPAGAAG